MANVFYRYDSWVRSTLGASVPGAQVYVCTQPANVGAAPPSPLAAIYSDSGGLVPITQPMITDGFGHVNFYALPGLYTVVIAQAGLISQVYPDQSLGGVGTTGGGGGAPAMGLLLEVNGAQLSSQLQQNLLSGTGIALTDAGNGGVQFANTGVTSITVGAGLSASGSTGNILLTNTSTGPSFGTSGQGYFFGPGIFLPIGAISRGSGSSWSPASNSVNGVQFTMAVNFTVTKATMYVAANSIGDHCSFAIFNAAGTTKLLDTGVMSLGTIGLVTATFSPVNLVAGTTYLFVQTATTNSATITTTSSLSINDANLFNGGTATRIFKSSVASSGGTMPSSLGTLNPVTNVTVFDIALIMFEP